MNVLSNDHPSYNPDACCGQDCVLQGMDSKEPCWGDVSVVDEVDLGDGDWTWSHACEGHWDCVANYGQYKPFTGPPSASPNPPRLD
jgi:hypothetical protein